MPNSVARTIREANTVSDAIEADLQNHPRLRDAVEGLKWVLARDPERGVRVGGTKNPLRVYQQASRGEGIPTIEVLYVFDDALVDIVSFRVV